ncbi:unnamed protein product, partial [Ectocarpus sp. 6 AP-2014]
VLGLVLLYTAHSRPLSSRVSSLPTLSPFHTPEEVRKLVSYGDNLRRRVCISRGQTEQEANFTALTAAKELLREGTAHTFVPSKKETKGSECGWSIMAAMRGGRGGIEDELVGAAMQISTLGKENKRVKRELASAVSENARRPKTHEDSRKKLELAHSKEIEDMTKAIEDAKKNEQEAIETAEKTFAELKNCTIEKEKIKTELGEARAALAEAAAVTARAPANRRRVTAIGVRPISPV